MLNTTLKKNLLIIRELYSMFYSQTKSNNKNLFNSVTSFYVALSTDSDTYTNMLTKNSISDNKLLLITQSLEDYGISPEYLLFDDTTELRINSEISTLADSYINGTANRNEISKCLREQLYMEFIQQNEIVSQLFIHLYSLSCSMNDDICSSTEMLTNLRNEYQKDNTGDYFSIHYAHYISLLAQHVKDIEQDFPDFYAVAQQLEKNKTVHSDISASLHSLKHAVEKLQSTIE